MATIEYEPEGFDFSNCHRNVALCESGMRAPSFVSTGTTTVAAIYKDGIVMGADSRSTMGHVISNKRANKVHYITDSIFACGAGTAADLDQVANMISANMRLLELNSGRKARVITAMKMIKQHNFKHMGHIGAYLLVGGIDPTGVHLFDVGAGGNSMRRQFQTDGSGSYAARAILERDFKFGMTEDECKALVQRALEAGMHGDNASGNSFRMNIVDKNGARFIDFTVPEFCKPPNDLELEYKFKPGSTVVLKQKTINYTVVESMDVS